MNTIIYTIIAALIIGFILGLLLGLFKKIFAVKIDPKIQEIRNVLSGGNCGGCGYAGCERLNLFGIFPARFCAGNIFAQNFI